MSAEAEVNSLREQGNTLFRERKHQEAVHVYTQGIDLLLSVPLNAPVLEEALSVFYANRAACSLALFSAQKTLNVLIRW